MTAAWWFLGLDAMLAAICTYAVWERFNVWLAILVLLWTVALTVFHLDVITRDKP